MKMYNCSNIYISSNHLISLCYFPLTYYYCSPSLTRYFNSLNLTKMFFPLNLTKYFSSLNITKQLQETDMNWKVKRVISKLHNDKF